MDDTWISIVLWILYIIGGYLVYRIVAFVVILIKRIRQRKKEPFEKRDY